MSKKSTRKNEVTNLTSIANTTANSPIKPLTDTEKHTIITTMLNSCGMTVGNLKICMVDVRVLDVDLSYQRLTTSNVGKLIPIFDIENSDIIELSYRNNKLYVIDGVHRGVAAIVNGVPYLLAKIHTNWTRQEEAKAFRNQNENRTSLKPIESFKAGLVAKDPIDTMIKSVCDKYSLTVTKRVKNIARPMTAITSARVITKKYNSTAPLDWTFSIMNTSNWLTAPSATTAKHLNTFAAIYDKGLAENKLSEYTDNIMAALVKISPQQFDGIAITEYRQFEHRAAAHALMHDIAEGKFNMTEYLSEKQTA